MPSTSSSSRSGCAAARRPRSRRSRSRSLAGRGRGAAAARSTRSRKPFASNAPPSRPSIDGELSEEIWVRAPLVDDFHQVTPVECDAPSERTEVYVLYDRDALYIGARLFDAEPELINARILRQGQNINSRRPVLRPHRSVQQPPQRLPVRRQPERRALRRRLRRRHAAAVRLGRHLASGRAHHARGLDARDRDPVQDAVVRSVARRRGA